MGAEKVNGTGHAEPPITLRKVAVGAVSGALAGTLFGVSAVLIQTAVTGALVGRYGSSAVDHGAAFLHSGQVIPMGFLGGFVGILYVVVRQRVPLPALAAAPLFAAVLTLVLQPLFAAGLNYFSAFVSITHSGTTLSGFVKTGSVPEDVAPSMLLAAIMAALLFLEGLAIAGFARLGTRWMPRLPDAVYAILATVLGIPGLAFFGLYLLVAMSGGGE